MFKLRFLLLEEFLVVAVDFFIRSDFDTEKQLKYSLTKCLVGQNHGFTFFQKGVMTEQVEIALAFFK